MAMMRSGSNLLQQKMSAISGVMCHGEIFNMSQCGLNPEFKQSASHVRSLESIDRSEQPVSYLNRLIELSDAEHIGFRLFDDHNNSIIAPLVDDSRITKIILMRNFLESYVSLQIAKQNKQWILSRISNREEWKPVTVYPKAFQTYALRQILFYNEIINRCVMSGQSYLPIQYSELNDPKTDETLLKLVGSHRKIDHSKIFAQRQNPEPLELKIQNYTEVVELLAKMKLNRILA